MKTSCSHIPLFVLFSLMPFASCKDSPVEPRPQLTPDYEIWSVVLDSLTATVMCAIGDTTDSIFRHYSPESDSLFRVYMKASIPSIDTSVINDFLRNAKSAQRIETVLKLNKPYVLLDPSKVLTDYNWYLSTYPNAGPFIIISRPGYNANFTEALVSIDFIVPMAGNGQCCYLTKTAKGWVLQQTVGTWVS